MNFGSARLRLELPLRFKQNWTLLFQDFNNEADGLALQAFRRYARKASFIFDVGMNAGLYFYHAVSVRGSSARVYGFEPNRDLVDLVSRNVERNHLTGVEVINKGVAAAAGAAEFFLTNTEHMNSLSEKFLRGKGRPVLGSIQVPVVRIDDFVWQNGIRADLLKIDVEGLEPGVIAGAWETIESYRPTMLIEIADENIGAEFVGDLLGLGYRCFHLNGRNLIEIWNSNQVGADRPEGQQNYLFTMELEPELQKLVYRKVA